MKIVYTLLSMISYVLLGQLLHAGISHAEEIYPNPDWKRKSYTEVFDENIFLDVISYIDGARVEGAEEEDYSTDGFLIIKDNHLVFEKYYNGFNKDKPHAL